MGNFWEKKDWQLEDKHLTALAASPFRRKMPDLSLTSEAGLYIMRGPRQVGKSSWLKSILSDVEDPEKAFYLSCENLKDFKDLSMLLDSIKERRSLILLDEVTYVDEWWRSIKNLIDAGYKGKIILTGSQMIDLKKGADRMPGRLKINGELFLFPMNFDEFIQAKKDAGWCGKDRLLELKHFFKIGGFPRALVESGKEQKDPLEAKFTYKNWLIGDAIKAGKQEQYIKEIMLQLAICTGSSVSLQTLAQKTQFGSHNTAQEYIKILEACFALRTLYAIDQNEGSYHFRKEKKFYFTDPLIYWIALENSGFPIPQDFEAQLAEQVAHEEICRRYNTKNNRLGYLPTKKGEVDFVSFKKWAIEIKWAEYVKNISEAFKNLLIPEKKVWYQDNFLLDWPEG